MSQHLLLSLWVDPLRADRLAAPRPQPALLPDGDAGEHPRPWVPGRWRSAFGNTSGAGDAGRTPVPAVRVPAQRVGSPTDDQQPARSCT